MNSYIDFVLAGSAMPVLLRAKTASLISFGRDKAGDREMLDGRLREVCDCFQVRYQYMYAGTTRVYTLIYAPELLEQRLRAVDGHWILRAAGYRIDAGPLEMLQRLACRLSAYHRAGAAFPDEIGLFLGYPVGDVEAYIRYDGKYCRYSGYWKAYENEARAKRVSRQYKQMQCEALGLIRAGYDICEYGRRHVME